MIIIMMNVINPTGKKIFKVYSEFLKSLTENVDQLVIIQARRRHH